MLGNQFSLEKKTTALAVIALILASAAVGQSLGFTISASAGAATSSCDNMTLQSVKAIGHEEPNTPANVLDNKLTTRWSHDGKGSWITVDAGSQKTICYVNIAWYKGDSRINDFTISLSSDGSNFVSVFAGKSSGKTNFAERYEFADTQAQYVKITVNGNTVNNWASITEIDVFGYAVVADTTAPSIKITKPTADAVFQKNAIITVEGSSSDNVAIKTVEVRVDSNSYVTAVPKSPGDWSTWSISIQITEAGSHRIVSRATDTANNQAWNSLYVTIQDNDNSSKNSLDKFGIAKIYETKTGAREWFSNWDNGVKRTLYSGDRDPSNNEFIARGDGRTAIDGAGTAIMSGSAPRMYVYDRAEEKKWNNVEITFYAKRVSESQTLSYQGFVSGTRSEHQDTSHSNPCVGQTYYGRMTYDGRVTFQKEIVHGESYSDTKPSPTVYPWNTSDKQVPKNQWIGYKYIVRTVDEGQHVNMQLYTDLTNGVNGGSWEKLIEYTDAGGWQQTGSNASCPGISPDKILLEPGTSTFVRNDGISEAHYKWFSIREIQP